MSAQQLTRTFLLIVMAMSSTGCQLLREKMAWNKSDKGRSQSSPLLGALTTPGGDEDAVDPSPLLTNSQKADIQMVMARSLEKSGEMDQAIRVYLDAVRKDEKRGDAYHRLAVLHDKIGQPLQAERYYRQALVHDQNDPELHADLGYSYYLRRNFPMAENSLKRALAIKPDLARAHNNLGLVLARTGRHDEALVEFARAGLNEASGRTNLAHALMLEQRWSEARWQCDQAIASRTATSHVHARLQHMRTMVARAQTSQPIGQYPLPADPTINQATYQAPAGQPIIR